MNRIKHFSQVLFFGFMPILLMIGLSGCDEPTRQERFENAVENYGGVPSDATNIEFIDGEWYTFEWRGQCFLASNDYGSTAGTGLLTKIDCEDK